MLSLLDPEGKLIDHRLYRESCICRDKEYIKDLKILRNRKLSNIVIADNKITSFAAQLDNGIHVPSYYGQADDDVLLTLLEKLKSLAENSDFLLEVKKIFGLSELYKNYSKVLS